MNEEKLLTISIAAYNVEKYIEKSISSCLSEETNNLVEVLVIDDGSTDKTAQVASKFEREFPNVVHVIRKHNGGYGSTVNTAIPLASGKYFKLLDGDDWFDKSGLLSLLTDLQKVDADMVLTPFLSISEKNGEKKLCSDATDIQSGEYPIEFLTDKWDVIRMHSVTFKTKVLRSVNLKLTEHCFYTDVEFVFAPLPGVKKVYVSHTPVYCYRIGRNEQSMSVSGIRKHFDDHGVILNYLFQRYDQLKDTQTDYARIMYSMLKRECYGHYRYYCLLQINLKNRRNLMNYDKKLMNRKQLYEQLGKESKVIFGLRATRFIAYPFACILERIEKK